jgi:Rho GDP-dissociation inhibitor
MSESVEEEFPQENYKPGEKKTLEELALMDAQDESLKKWKESLGVKTGVGSGSGPNVEMLSMGLEISGREDIMCDLSSQGTLPTYTNYSYLFIVV